MKPGIYTTEFWLTLAVNLVTLLSLSGVIGESDKGMVEGSVQTLVLGAASLVTLVQYIKSRVELKS